MTNIVKIEPDGQGGAWGFDSDTWKWVPVDPQAAEGSFAGNVGRAAGRGFEAIGTGLEQLAGQDDPGEVENLRARQQAASNVAPWAEGIGGAAPEVAAGLAAAPFTGGMSMPIMLGTEALIGAGTGFVRPGSIEERARNAGVSALLNVGGASVAPIVGSAMRTAFGVSRQVTEGATAAVADGVEAGGMRLAAREAQQAAEGGAPAGKSVGAAETPAEHLGDDFAQQNLALEATEKAGAEIDNPYMASARARAEEDGYISPFGAGTRAMSPARLAAAAQEMNPFGEGSRIQANNQKYVVAKLSDALGLDRRTSMSQADLGDAAHVIGEEFEAIERQLPAIEAKPLAKALESVIPTKALIGDSPAQKLMNTALKQLQERGDGFITPEELAYTRKRMNDEMADFFARGRTADGEAMLNAVEKLDKVIERRLKQLKVKDDVMGAWGEARNKWRVYKAAKNAISPQGEVNILTLRRALQRDASKGGFGHNRPTDPASGRLWDAVHVMAADQTGVPMTGARMLTAGRMAAKVGVGAAATSAGLGGAYSLWEGSR